MKNGISHAALAAITATVFTLSATPLLAQSVDIAAECSANAESCAALVQGQIDALLAAGLTGVELDAALGLIASQVYSVAQTAPPSVHTSLAAAIEVAASHATSPSVTSGLQQAAATVSRGAAASTPATAVGLSEPTDTPDTSGTAASPT